MLQWLNEIAATDNSQYEMVIHFNGSSGIDDIEVIHNNKPIDIPFDTGKIETEIIQRFIDWVLEQIGNLEAAIRSLISLLSGARTDASVPGAGGGGNTYVGGDTNVNVYANYQQPQDPGNVAMDVEAVLYTT